jgi:tricorn protease-like protein/C-terminal processing protease CtpA/Prc
MLNPSRVCLLSLVSGLAVALPALAQNAPASNEQSPHAGMLRFPDVSKDSIAFVYANDVWIAPREGGLARPLSSPVGMEMFPRFSPDGSTLAFVGNYEGNQDLYTMPVAPGAGAPSRVTHHPAAEVLSDWTPDNQLLFYFNGLSGLQRQQQVWTVPAAGGMPTQAPVPYGAFAAISPDGNTLAYIPHTTDFRTWKRYRGGMATDIWLLDLKKKTSQRATRWEGTDSIPMWAPGNSDVLYYLSDAGPEHRLNIWSFALATGETKQITKHTEFDVKWPSMGPGSDGKGEIVFQLGAELRLLSLASLAETTVKVTIPGDRGALRPRMIDAARNVQGSALSPSGKRVIVGARGDLWSAPAKEGSPRNLTRTDGAFERDPAWSPDGKFLAYFSDESGEFELYIRPSDARPPVKDDKAKAAKPDEAKAKDNKSDDGKAEEAKPEEAKPDTKPDTKPDEAKAEQAQPILSRAASAAPLKLTSLGKGYRRSPVWSPDSKWILTTDEAGHIFLTDIEKNETETIATNPWGEPVGYSWSHDSKWITYSLPDNDNNNGVIYLYSIASRQATPVTSRMFASTQPTFDRKGDFLYFVSARDFSDPMYSDLDTTFIYTGSEGIFAVPLRSDVKNPLLPKSDEETLKEDKKANKDKDKKDEPKKDEAKKGEAEGDEGKKDESKQDAAAADAITGRWVGQAKGEGVPGGSIEMVLNIKLDGNAVTGRVTSPMGGGDVSGTFDAATGKLSLTLTTPNGAGTIDGTVTGGSIEGTWNFGGMSGSISATKQAGGGGSAEKGEGDKADDEKKELIIDLDGFEARAMRLPISRGSFGNLAVSDGNKLLFVRFGSRGQESQGIRIFDIAADEPEEKAVMAGNGFELSADGKKLLVGSGAGLQIADASAGAKGTSVPTAGMMTTIDPRNEWRQILTDTYRIFRDYFYEPTMHNIDWKATKERYMTMIDDCISREDVAYVQAEMISELNVGHAYINAPGDVQQAPSIGVGLLGADFELATVDGSSAYRIARILTGAPWDVDARGPLSQPGVRAAAGDYILAVDGVPIDTSNDIYASFIDTANRTTLITLGKNPAIDSEAWDIVVRPIASEASLRYRAWVENNRRIVDERSKGQVGYIYVPNTGVDGQNELFRQFFGQRHLPALLIDDRWNGGGQIPTRFIELLNRPTVNYWARRNGNDWPWPPDAHFGHKAMLINGLAGSGGDAFPHYFRQEGLGKLFGTRTWGGLVGISGNPGLIDGGSISVPTFGFYNPNGNWGIEGHGVDPDVEVIDDPAFMQGGNDPQLNAAIDHLLEEIRTKPVTRPARPRSPDRSGMGIPQNER